MRGEVMMTSKSSRERFDVDHDNDKMTFIRHLL